MNWKDTTSYSRDDKDKVPSCWTTETRKIRISVLNGHRFYPGQWVMHCYDLNIRERIIGNMTDMNEDDAKSKSIDIARKELSAMMSELS
jgi:hypothetical protein